jgi:ABC-type lipoprotein export system ATPase subunit
MEPIITVEKIRKTYDGKRFVLDEVNLTVNRGELVIIEGKSGAGKSTFLNILGLLDTFTSGTYYIEGKAINPQKLNQYSSFRSEKIGFIFQSYQLIESISIEDNLLIPFLYMNAKIDSKLIDRMNKILKDINLLEMKNKPIKLLSGGEKQRVAIARAILKDSDIIIADEPTGNLDGENSQIILDAFLNLARLNKAVIVVTHNPSLFSSADKKFKLEGGKLCLC